MKNFLQLISLFFCLIVSASAYAQVGSVSLMGTVIDDATKEPLIGATVIVDGTTKGGVTDFEGNFEVPGLVKGTLYNLTINFFGYVPYKFSQKMANANIKLPKPIVVKPDNLVVEEVVVVGSPPIAVQLGDTTQFNAGAYKTNPDATAEDLIAKMPGFEITEDGKIQTGGEDVTTIYVDGRPYFSDNPVAALASLPASVIESIQLLDEKSETSKFTGADDGETVKTINIVTKSKDDTMRLGDFSAGYGTDNRYTARANVNMFTDKHRVTAVVGANNLNQSATGGGAWRYYARHWQKGIEGVQSGRVNYSGDFKKDSIRYTKVGFNYVYDRGDKDQESSSTQLSTVSDYTYSSRSNSNAISDKHSFFLKVESRLSEKDRIVFKPKFNLNNSESHSSSSTERFKDGRQTNGSWRESSNESGSYNFNGTINWMHAINERQTLVVNGGASLSESSSEQHMEGEDSEYNYDAAKDTTSLVLNPAGQETSIFSNSNRVHGGIDYVYRFNDRQSMTAEYNTSYNWSESSKDTYKYNEVTNVVDDLNINLSNSFERDYFTNGGQLSYSYNKRDVFRFTAKAGYENSTIDNNMIFYKNDGGRDPKKYGYSYNNIIGNMFIELPITKSKRLTLYYRARPKLPSATQLQDVINDTDPLKVSSGNPNLDQSYNNVISVRYVDNNFQKSTSLKAYLWGNNDMNSIANEIQIMDKDTQIGSGDRAVIVKEGSQLTTPVNAGNKWNLYTGVEYSFPIKLIKSKMNTALRYNYSNSPSVYEGKVNYTKNNFGLLYFSLISNVSENVDFTLGSRSTYSHTQGRTKDTYFLTESAFVKFNWIFLKNFVFNTTYDMGYSLYSTQDRANPMSHILNAGLGYKFYHNKAEVRINGYDLLNQNKNYSQSVSDQFITNSTSLVMQRYVLVSLSYKFNSLQDKSRRVTQQLKELMNLQEVDGEEAKADTTSSSDSANKTKKKDKKNKK